MIFALKVPRPVIVSSTLPPRTHEAYSSGSVNVRTTLDAGIADPDRQVRALPPII